MARPPRVPVWLPLDQPVTYFVTLGIAGRRRVLDNAAAWNACRHTLARLDRWQTLACTLMPDHAHFLVGPIRDRDAPLGQWMKWFKRWFCHVHPHDWEWQEGGFDRLLRGSESAEEKWRYIRENPVRADLVQHWEAWPYSFGFGRDNSPPTRL
ncbi:MAG TPA: hypothetical protein PLU30_09930 [Verrucomicrobiae bacterium]|nr:hypothetical protein [Verrucomicrobiae bacterium]